MIESTGQTEPLRFPSRQPVGPIPCDVAEGRGRGGAGGGRGQAGRERGRDGVGAQVLQLQGPQCLPGPRFVRPALPRALPLALPLPFNRRRVHDLAEEGAWEEVGLLRDEKH